MGRFFLRIFAVFPVFMSLAFAGDVALETDITFLPSDRKEKMDAYLPPDSFERPLPAVLLIHGGAWRKGDKADPRERNIGNTLASHGFAVFSVNYLLNEWKKGPDEKQVLSRLAWPRNLIDCKIALRFLRANASRFGIDSNRIAVMGSSAGAHLAMLVGSTVGQKKFNQGPYVEQRNDVSCVINFYGDADIRGRAVSPFAGADRAESDANEAAASPVTYFDGESPPMLIVHGTEDKVISVERSRALVHILQKCGVEYRYVEIPGAPHAFHLQPEQLDLRPVVLEFLKKYLAKKRTEP